MKNSFIQRVRDAILLSPEEYSRRHKYSTQKLMQFNELMKTYGEYIFNQDIPHITISGGSSSVRNYILAMVAAGESAQGKAVIVIRQTQNDTPQYVQRLSAIDGSYDPIQGISIGEAEDRLCDIAYTLELSPTIHTPISDELKYLFQRDGEITMSSFISSDSRDIAANAFLQGKDQIAESHTLPGSLDTDILRRELLRNCQFKKKGRSILQSVKEGEIVLVELPRGKSSGWIGAVFSELQDLCNTSIDFFTIFSEIPIPQTCQKVFEALSPISGRCLSYEDLPSMGWLWSSGVSAATAGFFMRHSGQSASKVSDFFHQIEREKITYSQGSSKASSDTISISPAYTKTYSASTTVSTSYQWENIFPASYISKLMDNESVFFCGNNIGACLVPKS